MNFSGELLPFTLDVIHGVVLTLIIIGLIRLRATLLWANAVIAVVAALALFLLVDGVVSGAYSTDVGLICGTALALTGAAIYGRLQQPRRRSNR